MSSAIAEIQFISRCSDANWCWASRSTTAWYLAGAIPSMIDAGAAKVFITQRDSLTGPYVLRRVPASAGSPVGSARLLPPPELLHDPAPRAAQVALTRL